jgi:KaiC/GvpD/RAD55 family RecA-like ATPase
MSFDDGTVALPELHPEVIAANQVIEALNHLERRPESLMRWPFSGLDTLVGPMGPGEVWYVCGFSGGGKTTFVASAIDRWRERGKRVYVMPLELQPWRFRLYLACMALEIHPGDALSGQLRAMPNGDAHAEALKAEMLSQTHDPYTRRVMVGSERAINVVGLEAALMKAKAFGADVIVIDHIDHIEPNITGGNGYADGKQVNHALLRMAQDNDLLIVATSQLNNAVVGGGQDRMARYQPPREHHVLMGGKKREVATGMIGLYRPLRAQLPNESFREFRAALKAARSGHAEPHTVLEPHVVGVSAMKLRNYGQHEGKRVTLGFQVGRVVDLLERDKYTTNGGYVRQVLP